MYIAQRIRFLLKIEKFHHFVLQKKFYNLSHLRSVVKKENLGHEMPIGWQHGHPDDPEYNTKDKQYLYTPNKDEPIPEFVYRKNLNQRSYLDRFMHKLLSSIFWSWFLYMLYWNNGLIFGHHTLPYLDEFTDEELGILPDTAPDPVYWGTHCKS